jgi:hypothetical protein
VLKSAWLHTEALHEAEGLAALGGRGAVEVHAFAPQPPLDVCQRVTAEADDAVAHVSPGSQP